MPELDERQKCAVSAGPSDLFIAAGAGSGKTRVLTARFIAAILGQPPFEPTAPEELLTVTFTEKAAGELAERVRRGLVDAGRPDAARRISDSWISTIHAMCARIVRRHALDLGIDPRFGVLDQIRSSVMLTESLDAAIGDLIDEDGQVTALVDEFGFLQVSAALRSARADLVAAGRDVSDLMTITPEQVNRMLRRAADEASELADGFADLRQVKTTMTNAAEAKRLAVTLQQATGGALGDVEGLDMLASINFRHLRSVEGHEELVDAAKALLERGCLCVAQRVVATHERAFIRVLDRFAVRYTDEKRARGVLDFEDLQVLTAKLLHEREDIAEKYRAGFAMIMVDEFQDTNALQMSIIERLADGDLCTVGDENQSIYSFRHADVEVFRRRGRTVPTHVELDINYRIAAPLLASINGLFSNATLLGESYMWLRSPEPPPQRPEWPGALPRFNITFVDTTLSDADPFESEAGAIADRVAGFVRQGVAPGDIAVLMGALSRGRGARVARELEARSIPAILAAGGAFFECPEVREARAFLHVIDNVHDDRAVLSVLAGRIAALDADSLYIVRSHVEQRARGAQSEDTVSRRPSLWDALPDALAELPGSQRERVTRVIEVVEAARKRQGIRPLSETLIESLTRLDFDITLCGEGQPGVRAWANVAKLARMGDEYESSEHGGLGGFLRHLELREEHGTGEPEAFLDEGDGAVRIMSIHAAKGLEFPVVVVGSLTADSGAGPIDVARVGGGILLGMSLPAPGGSRKTLGAHEVQEARKAVREAERRRLFYVACTRAREGLSVVGRTRSDRAADGSLTGILRSIAGMAEPGTLRDVVVQVGEGTIAVSCVGAIDEPESDEALQSEDSPPRRAGEGGVPAHLVVRPEAVCCVTTAPHGVGEPQRVPPVSYTALAAYERCGYHYYLTRVARLPAPMRSTTTAALDFGSALHLVLQRVTEPDALDPVLPEVMLATGVDPARRQALEAAAGAFLSSPLARRLRSAGRVVHEAPFLVPLAGTVLSGAMDVIAWEGADALIIDYKTGAGALDEGEARERYRLQAECYGLAALHGGARHAEVVFAELERERSIGFEYDASETAHLAERIAVPIHAIGRGEFAPRDAYVRGLCDACPGFGGLCPVRRPKVDASA